MNLNYEVALSLSVVTFYFPLVVLNIWKKKVRDEKARHIQLGKFSIAYGKAFVLIVSLQFLMCLLLLFFVI